MLALIILDGFGYQDSPLHNAIAEANPPHYDKWWHDCPHLLIDCSGEAVGLPTGQMGNSEVGHMHIGSGRIIQQDLTRIDDAITNGSFESIPALQHALATAKKQGNRVHVMGLLSPGGVHSHESHLFYLASLLGKAEITHFFHLFLDGRDTPPRSAMPSITALTEHLSPDYGEIASLCGRYYAMDRDKRWARTQAAYDCLTLGKTDYQAPTATSAVAAAYAREESDEFISPTRILTQEASDIRDGDIIIFMNFRADRTRQLTQAFIDPDFTAFPRERFPKLAEFFSLTRYSDTLDTHILFPTIDLRQTLGEVVSQHHLKQLRIAETEKYPHVTFFFNGGQEAIFEGEDRILVPSPLVSTYDKTPCMSAPEITEKLINAIQETHYDLIICNFANADMVGHTGNYKATMEAITCLDNCLNQIVTAITQQGGQVIITADHGNAEKMFDEISGQAHTAHTTTPVPFVYIGQPAKITKNTGSLIDIAPTILSLMGLPIPAQMTGQPLIERL